MHDASEGSAGKTETCDNNFFWEREMKIASMVTVTVMMFFGTIIVSLAFFCAFFYGTVPW